MVLCASSGFGFFKFAFVPKDTIPFILRLEERLDNLFP